MAGSLLIIFIFHFLSPWASRIAGLASFWLLQRDTLQVPKARHSIYRVLWKIQALPMFGSYDFVTGINP
jgi:hypothetical protein